MRNKKFKYKKRLEAPRKISKREIKPVIKKRFRFLKIALRAAIILFAAAEVFFYSQNFIVPKFYSKRVDEGISFYGANEKYLRKDNLNLGYVKFVPKDTEHIKVGVSDAFTGEQKQQFAHVYDYLNKTFNVINPKYKFEMMVASDSSNCDIFIDKMDIEENTTAAQTQNKYSFFDSHRINKNVIYFNSEGNYSNAELRVYLAHEMMHALTGASDVGFNKDLPVSVFEYHSANAMARNLTHYDYLPDDESNVKMRDEYITYLPS